MATKLFTNRFCKSQIISSNYIILLDLNGKKIFLMLKSADKVVCVRHVETETHISDCHMRRNFSRLRQSANRAHRIWVVLFLFDKIYYCIKVHSNVPVYIHMQARIFVKFNSKVADCELPNRRIHTRHCKLRVNRSWLYECTWYLYILGQNTFIFNNQICLFIQPHFTGIPKIKPSILKYSFIHFN